MNYLQSLLTHVSRPTKNILNKLGVFTVSSFHAFICARSPSLLNNLLAGRGATKRRPPMLSRSNSGSSRRSMQVQSTNFIQKTFILFQCPTMIDTKRNQRIRQQNEQQTSIISNHSTTKKIHRIIPSLTNHHPSNNQNELETIHGDCGWREIFT